MNKVLPSKSEFPDALNYPDKLASHQYTNYPMVNRCFAFVDLSGFTAYTQQYGSHQAAELLLRYRTAIRSVVGRRGVRVAKWLGDGVMLVSERTAPVAAAVLELKEQAARDDYSIHAGMAYGSVIIFEGDDFIGATVNIAARLSSLAGPNEVLIHNLVQEDVPIWAICRPITQKVSVRGVGAIDDVAQLEINRDYVLVVGDHVMDQMAQEED